MDRQDDSILEEFLAEMHENLGQLERDLIALERDASSSELLARILRAFHTIKGTCGFFGFVRLQSLTHAAEGLLVRCRDGGVPVDGRMGGLLLDVIDDARRIVRSIETQRNEGDRDVSAGPAFPRVDSDLSELAPQHPVLGVRVQRASLSLGARTGDDLVERRLGGLG